MKMYKNITVILKNFFVILRSSIVILRPPIVILSEAKNPFINKVKHLLFLILAFFSLVSCEKVIDIDLNAKDPKIVIEGNITNQSGPNTVILHQTVNFDQPNDFTPVSDATVTITDNTGYSELLTETSSGVYITSKIQGTPGRTYNLKVISKDKEYSATSTMPIAVNIDTLIVETRTTPKGSSNKTLYIGYTDPAGIANYYRYIEIINGITQSTIFIDDDLLQDGETIKQGLLPRSQDVTSIKKGDYVNVILQSVDKNVYDYFRTLLQSSITNLMNSSTSPANPLSNFSNGALGYFNACSVSNKTITIR